MKFIFKVFFVFIQSKQMKKFIKQQLTYISFYFLYNKDNIIKFKNVLKWVKALESGKYTQCVGRLYNDRTGGYCCLGVGSEELNILDINKNASLDYGFRDAVGLKTVVGQYNKSKESLTMLNDVQNKNFYEIAEVIKSSPKGLFIEPINKMVEKYYKQ